MNLKPVLPSTGGDYPESIHFSGHVLSEPMVIAENFNGYFIDNVVLMVRGIKMNVNSSLRNGKR